MTLRTRTQILRYASQLEATAAALRAMVELEGGLARVAAPTKAKAKKTAKKARRTAKRKTAAKTR